MVLILPRNLEMSIIEVFVRLSSKLRFWTFTTEVNSRSCASIFDRLVCMYVEVVSFSFQVIFKANNEIRNYEIKVSLYTHDWSSFLFIWLICVNFTYQDTSGKEEIVAVNRCSGFPHDCKFWKYVVVPKSPLIPNNNDIII